MSDFGIADLQPGVVGGIDRELHEKNRRKEQAAGSQKEEVRWWIETVTGIPIGNDFNEGLKNGVILCELINRLKPGAVQNIYRGSMMFRQMENISSYLAACKDHFGLTQVDMFVTDDLFAAKNIPQVLLNIYSLSGSSRKVGFGGPFIGTKKSERNDRNFSAEVLARGKSAPSRQTVGSYGYQPGLDSGMDKIKRLDESQSKSAGGTSRQVTGSQGYQPKLGEGMDKIKRLDESQSKSAGGTSRQVTGSQGYQPKLGEGMDKIKRLDEAQSRSTGGTSRQVAGSYGYQPKLGEGMDKIKRLDEAQSKSYGGTSRQVAGSYGYQPKLGEGMDKIKRLDEAQSKSAGGTSRQVAGSYGYQPKLGEGMDKIKRLDEAQSKSAGGTSRQVAGSYGYQPKLGEGMDKIKRLDDASSASYGGVSRQTQGSYGFQDTSDRRGVDQIIRNVDELAIDREKARNRQY